MESIKMFYKKFSQSVHNIYLLSQKDAGERGKSIIETILSNAIFDIIKLELTELFERGILPVRRAGRWV